MANMDAQLKTAREHLAEVYPEGLTADAVHDYLATIYTTPAKPISVSTIGPKLRSYARRGELTRDYFIGENNRRQVRFIYNPAYHQVEKQAAHADFLCDQAKDEVLLTENHKEIMK